MKYGIELIDQEVGEGPVVEPKNGDRIRLKMWLNKGDPVRWQQPWGSVTHAYLEDDGATLVTSVRNTREFLIPGLYYGIEGMRVGGTRTLRMPPGFAYGDEGLDEVVPPNAVIRAEVTILSESDE